MQSVFALVTSGLDLENLASDWNDLYARAGTSLFTDYRWFMCWWAALAKSQKAQLRIVTSRRDGRLVGVLPLVVRRRFGINILEWAAASILDYPDVLIEEAADSVELWKAARRLVRFDLAIIKNIRRDALCHPVLSSFSDWCFEETALHLPIVWKSSKDWLASLSSNTRGQLKRKQRLLERRGEVAFETFRHGTPPPSEIIDIIVDQKLKWHVSRGDREQSGYRQSSDFLARILALMSTGEELHVSYLRCGECVAATQVGFVYGNRYYFYQTSYDSEFEQASPGILLLQHSICQAIDAGLEDFDFLRGRMEYKRRFSRREHKLSQFVFCGSVIGKCAMYAMKLHRSLKPSVKLDKP